MSIEGDKITDVGGPQGTSIWIPYYLKEILDNAKLHPREPYYQVIERICGGVVNGGPKQ